MSILENLENILRTEVAVDLAKESLGADENLLEQGIIDSLGIMKLIIFIEKAFGIKVPDEDVVPENFESLNSMARFIEQKMSNK